jgi:hypothetical protein
MRTDHLLRRQCRHDHRDLLRGGGRISPADARRPDYGVNFDVMPELQWQIGYPFAIGLMVLSAVMPFLYFKRRGWL